MTAYKVNFQNTNHSRLTQATETLALIAVTALSILPIFLVELPAMNDYPGHLARMYVLASFGTPDQSPYYYFYLPYVYPNLAMDVGQIKIIIRVLVRSAD